MILDGSYEIWNVYLLFWRVAAPRLEPSPITNGPHFGEARRVELAGLVGFIVGTHLDFEEFGNLPRFPNPRLTGLTRLG
jgi:hypothetical protein